ncbi:hypothetical protein EI553_13370 [Shigella sonnei]|uniref:Uncharacterized protein n=1 Tax=Shigella sonnei TaxID=624 RepID=A0AAU8W6C7_SHISO|nr:hypothetical protein B9127_02105 [Shigella sonnei]ARS07809.1 hypothetical protein BZ172_22750 [Shigella sonnei]ASN33406.1 hypothetical protein B9129_01485 [Shigella sonnei]ASN44013.1 hypothetical protein B9128_17915 [Shigella sonnei]AWX18023.1 hypothetical protein CH310_10715 [Shigella sonnei]
MLIRRPIPQTSSTGRADINLRWRSRFDKSTTRYFIRTPYNGVLASQTRHDYCPQSSMIRGVMSPGLVGRW